MNNSRIKNITKTLLSNNWFKLHKYAYDFKLNNGKWESHQREAYDKGNGVAILLYNKNKKTVVLTKQFRLPTFINGNADGFMIEVPAGVIDKEHPNAAIKREVEEETGYHLSHVEKVFELYMSPGAVTEKIFFYISEYNSNMKKYHGGGVEKETEDIEVMELPFTEAITMMQNGTIKDAKTYILLQYAQINQLLDG